MKELAKRALVAATLATSLGYACNSAAMAAVDIKIGVAAPMTGAQAHYGEDFKNGVILATEDFNASQPVIGGRPIRIVLDAADDQADPRIGTMVAQKLVDDGIKGMLGHFNSGTAIPASRIYSQAGIPQLAMATAPEYTQQGFATTFRMMTSDSQQGAVIGAYAVEGLKFKRIAIIDDRSAYGQGLADQFQLAAKAAGATIVDREFTNDKAVDFKAILTKIKAKRPDAIFFGGTDAQAGPMAKQLRTLGMATPLMAGEMVKTPTFLKTAGTAAEGTIATLAGLPLAQMPSGNDYMARYKKRFGAEVQTYSPYSYDGAMAMFTAMKKADSTDPAKYLPVLASIEMVGITSDRLGYDTKGNLKHGGVTVYRVESGQWVALESINP